MALVEREDALSRLHLALERAREGSGSVVLVSGEAGIGKTSLARAFTDSVGDGVHLLWGGCDDLLTARPLAPIWDMAFDEPKLSEALTGDNRQQAFGAMYELLTRSLRPTVAVIEDVHWADEATVDMVKFVGRRIQRTHSVLLLTYRDADVTAGDALRLALGDLPQEAVIRVDLAPLSLEGIEQLTSGKADAVQISEITGGNPFFVTELLSSGEDVPISIRDSIRGRLSRLSDQARNVVELASVAPGRIELGLVENLMGDVADAVAECERTGILNLTADSLAFRHELARRAVEGELAEIRRRTLNLGILGACEARGEDLTRCAHHARAAGDAEAMMRLLPEAARRAADLESHSESVSHLRALEPYLDRMTTEELAGHYQLWAYEEYLASNEGGEEIIDKAVELRREMGEPEALGASLLLASRIAWVHSKRASAVEYAREAAQVLEAVGGESLGMAYSTLSQLAMLANDDVRALEFGEKAIGVAGSEPNAVHAHALNNIGTAKTNTSYPEGIEELERSRQMSVELDLPYEQTRALVNLAWAHLFARELDRVSPLLELGIQLTRDAEMPTFESYLVTEQAMFHEMRGEWDEAEELAQKSIEGTWAMESTKAAGSMVLGKVAVRRGAPDAKGLALSAWERAVKAGEIQRLAPAGSVLAEFSWLGGDIDERVLAELVDVHLRCIALRASLLGRDLAFWLSLLGLIDGVPAVFGGPHELLDKGKWEDAATFWERRSIPYELGVALSRGDEAARLRALGIFDGLGAAPIAARVRAELRAEGLTGIPRGPHRPTRESPLGLTPRQTDVLRLLAEGLTNAEIADRLFLSTRTVDHHVSAILSRTGADDRFEAVEIGRASGLIA